ncbi:hypothetical protein I6A60_08540 [Frankia sp. AgB1.9]|uniref:sensor histidine kinase n=1 Tax=unclassified Frankia TaxID=2632575 RepID=UPI001933876F|nr:MULTISPECIES: ATP-binding protein [unclassified Frankia]MBL7487174.1 hypothetical protein [Frankia sp. AgW1.1]MBL7547919.1 hypothetical protein [Frankia sp. AgB1.9]MBL7623956.1 hypothetical protein [Frankia sp. AgB1.8]
MATLASDQGGGWVGLRRLLNPAIRWFEGPADTIGGKAQAEWHIFVIFALLRTAFIIQGAVVAGTESGSYRPFSVVVGVLVAETGWSGWLLYMSWRRRSYADPGLATLDVAVTVAGLVIVGAACPPGTGETWTNWMFPFALNTVIGATFALRLDWALASAVALAVAHVGGASRGFAISPGPSADTIGNGGSYLLYIVFAAVTSRMVRSSGRRQDEATSRALAAERLQAASVDRIKQFGRIHDDVLSTLTLVARGVLRLNEPAVRARAGRNAQYLRDLMQGNVTDRPSGGLGADLAELIRERCAEGMTIDYQYHGLPADLPPEVVDAIMKATGEALTNVAKHTTSAAWVTALGEGDAVTVSIVDHGPGLPEPVAPGIGLPQTLRNGLARVGGSAEITSLPGEGTMVELRWPA